MAGIDGRAILCGLFVFLRVSAEPAHNNLAVFQPSEGLLSGRDFGTSLKLPRPWEGWATEKVFLEVPRSIRTVKPEGKPGWLLQWDGNTLVFEAQHLDAGALEFQLHVAAGCDFSNASEALTTGDRHLLVWRTVQQLRASNGSHAIAMRRWTALSAAADGDGAAPFLEVSSDTACGTQSSPGMLWLGQHVPVAAQAAELAVVGLEEDRTFDGHDLLRPHEHRNSRRGVHAGMAFGGPLHESGGRPAMHWPLWKVLCLLGFILFLLFAGAMLMAFVASTWTRFLVSSSREALLKEHGAKASCQESGGGAAPAAPAAPASPVGPAAACLGKRRLF